jgi:polyisoprenoid-binding protein YceI
MKNAIVIIIGLLMTVHLNAQKYFTRTGMTQFKASEEAYEPVEAVNKSTTAIFNTNTGQVVAQVFMAGFQFENALMQEHFNENYMDSHQYPKAIFKGELKDFSKEELSSNNSFDLDGILTIKGIEKEVQTKIYVKEEKKRLYVTTNFSVKPEDFDISIPSIVQNKIAKQIQISIKYELIEKK